MPHVLENWILKFELHSVEHLCPGCVLGVSKDPALVIFGLDHEHTESGHQDVINLHGAILWLQRDVIQKMKVRPGEVGLQLSTYQGFATVLERRGAIAAKQEANNQRQKEVKDSNHQMWSMPMNSCIRAHAHTRAATELRTGLPDNK